MVTLKIENETLQNENFVFERELTQEELVKVLNENCPLGFSYEVGYNKNQVFCTTIDCEYEFCFEKLNLIKL